MVFGSKNSSYLFSQFSGAADNRRAGRIYYRIKIITTPTTNLQCLISSAFAIPQFDYTQIVVITYYKLPHMRATDDSAVSYTTNQYL